MYTYIQVRDWCTHFKHIKPFNRIHEKTKDIKKNGFVIKIELLAVDF